MQRIGSSRPPPPDAPKSGSQLVTPKSGSQLVTKSGSQLVTKSGSQLSKPKAGSQVVKPGSQLKTVAAVPKKVEYAFSVNHVNHGISFVTTGYRLLPLPRSRLSRRLPLLEAAALASLRATLGTLRVPRGL
jgi:hypothetical protein